MKTCLRDDAYNSSVDSSSFSSRFGVRKCSKSFGLAFIFKLRWQYLFKLHWSFKGRRVVFFMHANTSLGYTSTIAVTQILIFGSVKILIDGFLLSHHRQHTDGDQKSFENNTSEYMKTFLTQFLQIWGTWLTNLAPILSFCSGLKAKTFANKFCRLTFPNCRLLFHSLSALTKAISVVFSAWAMLISFITFCRLS